MMSADKEKRAYVFRRFIKLKTGRVLDAHDYGRKAFKIPVSDSATDN